VLRPKISTVGLAMGDGASKAVRQARVADLLRRGLSAARFLTPFVRDSRIQYPLIISVRPSSCTRTLRAKSGASGSKMNRTSRDVPDILASSRKLLVGILFSRCRASTAILTAASTFISVRWLSVLSTASVAAVELGSKVVRQPVCKDIAATSTTHVKAGPLMASCSDGRSRTALLVALMPP